MFAVSDVWQGPGWWLASDGKWYPAEAESGEVFDGEIDGSGDSEAGDVVAAEPAATEPALEEAVQAEPVEAETVPSGGWKVDDVADDAADTSEDGWSSGFGDSSAAVVAETVVVEETEVITTFAEPVMMSGTDTADVESPEAPTTPEFEVPDLDVAGAPDIPDAPGIEIPDAPAAMDFDIPDAPEVPDVAGLGISGIPDVAGIDIPDAPAVPEIEIPEIDIPDIDVPDIDVPEIDVPEKFTMPGIDIPDAPTVPDAPAVPEIDIPDIDVPDVDLPDEFTVPDKLAGTPFEAAPPLDAITDPKPMPERPINSLDLRDDLLMDDDELQPKIPAAPSSPEPAIERTGSWRSPSKTDATVDSAIASTTGRPEVVDLAIPDQKPSLEAPTSDRNWGLIGGGVAVILLIAAIVWLASVLFSGGDSADTANDDAEVATPVTEEAEADEPAEDGSTGDFVSVFDLRQGDCIRGDIAGQILEVERVDCAESHDFEVYIERLIDDTVITEYDEATITEFSEGVCRSALAELVSPAENPSINFKFLQPTQDSWNSDAEDRLVTCLGFDEEGPLEGRFDDE